MFPGGPNVIILVLKRWRGEAAEFEPEEKAERVGLSPIWLALMMEKAKSQGMRAASRKTEKVK